MLGKALQFAVVFLDFFVAEGADDFGGLEVHALLDELLFDFSRCLVRIWEMEVEGTFCTASMPDVHLSIGFGWE
jgi:hypothetical protein